MARKAAENAGAEERRPDNSLPALRRRAQDVRKEAHYNGSMTAPLLLALAPLLNEPIDPRYIQTIGAVKGKPYESTGIRSVQVQIDRMNAIVGEPHWRKLLHYADGGAVCHAHVVVGNRLGGCRLADDGQLVLDGSAEVIAHRSGWGGHSKGTNRGDLYKGAETNALKRAIAQLGPGSEVYRLDVDEDQNVAGPEFAADDDEATTTDAPPPREDTLTRLAALLAQDDELRDLRQAVDQGMQIFGTSPAERLKRLEANATAGDLETLRERINLAIEERDAQQAMPLEDAS